MPCRAFSTGCFLKKISFFQKTKDRKVKQVLSWGWHQWEGDIRKGFRRVNVVEIFCTHVQKWKKKTCVKVFQEAGEKGE
jgi:hypothetical protein